MNRFDTATAAVGRKTITIFLTVILLTGTITSFYPSSFIGGIDAQEEALQDYKLYNYNSKYSAFEQDKIKCDNFNLNANGGLNVDGIPESLSGLLADAAQAGDAKIGNWEKRFGVDKEFLFKCLNNNYNEQSISPTQTPPSPPPIPPLLINKDWFVCNNEDIDCTIQVPEQQISFQGPNSGMYTECTSEQDCPFANDAGFIIEINGNSPTPNTIPAQINTEQQVEIEAGPFSVTEELLSDIFVPDAIFDVENVPVGQDIDFNIPALIIVFDETGQRVFTANAASDSISIIDLANANTVTNVPLAPSGGLAPFAIVFDEAGERVFTANGGSDSISIIDLANANTVTNVPLAPSGGDLPLAIVFDEAGQRVFTANAASDSVSIIEFPTINRICQDSGFDTGDIRTFESNGQTIQQITCVNFVGECSGEIEEGETRECTVQDYVVAANDVSNGNGVGIFSNMDKPLQQLFTNDISATKDTTTIKSIIQQKLQQKQIGEQQNVLSSQIKTSSLPTGPFIYEVPKH